jgi:hypothetical protein
LFARSCALLLRHGARAAQICSTLTLISLHFGGLPEFAEHHPWRFLLFARSRAVPCTNDRQLTCVDKSSSFLFLFTGLSPILWVSGAPAPTYWGLMSPEFWGIMFPRIFGQTGFRGFGLRPRATDRPRDWAQPWEVSTTAQQHNSTTAHKTQGVQHNSTTAQQHMSPRESSTTAQQQNGT